MPSLGETIMSMVMDDFERSSGFRLRAFYILWIVAMHMQHNSILHLQANLFIRRECSALFHSCLSLDPCDISRNNGGTLGFVVPVVTRGRGLAFVQSNTPSSKLISNGARWVMVIITLQQHDI